MSIDESMSVGLVGPMPPPAGGMAGQTAQLRDLLSREGVRVVFVPTNAAYRPACVGRIRGLRAAFRMIPYLRKLWQCAGEVDVLHIMANSGWSWHMYAAPAIWIGRLRRRTVVVNYRGGDAARFLARSGALVAPTIARADAIAVPSRFLGEVFARHGVASVVLPNIIDRARFHAMQRPQASANILVARHLEPIYDIGTAIRAFAIVVRERPHARLTIAGDGPERQRMIALAAQLGVADCVTFAGQVDRERIAVLIRESDIALNPSRIDNMPNSVLEALASGVPVVSTDVGGVNHVVTHERTALLIPPGDPAAMASALLRLIDDPELAGRLRANGLADVEQYTWPNVRERLFSIYRSAGVARAATGETA